MTLNPHSHLPLLFEVTPVAIIEWNHSFNQITGWNPAAERIFGYSAAEMINTNGVHLIPPYEIERVTATIGSTLEEKRSLTCVNKNICKDGRTILCEWINTPVCDSNGELLCVYSLVQDVTGRIVTQKELEESEQRFRDVSEAVGEYIWEISRDGVYNFISDRVKDVKGYTSSELLGKTPFEVMLPEDIPVVEELLKEACARKGSFRLIHRDITPTGDIVWEEVNGLPLLNSEGEIIGFRGAGLSITDRKLAEEALRESEARFNSIAANIPGVILRYVLSPDGTDAFQYVSPGCVDLYGVTAEAAMADPAAFFGRTHPDDLGKVQQTIIDSATTLTQWSSEFRLLLPGGEEKWVSGRGMPERQENGDIIWNAMLLDITQQKKAEFALLESEQRFRDVSEAAGEYIFETNADGVMTFLTGKVQEAKGHPKEKLLGNSAYDTVPEEDLKYAQRQVEEAIQKRTSFKIQHRNIAADGRILWEEVAGIPRWDEQGNLLGFRGVGMSITDRKLAEEALRESEARFQSIANNMPGLILRYTLRHDQTEGFLYLSSRCIDIFEVDSEEVLKSSQKIWDCFTPEDVSQMQISILESARTLSTWGTRNRMVTPSGKQKWIEAKGTPIRLENGDVIWDTILFDVTAQKEAEDALRQQQEALRQHNEAIAQLMRSNLTEQDIAEAAHTVTELITDRLQVNRGSIWLAPIENPSQLVCVDLYDHDHHSHSTGSILREEDVPQYFRALQTERIIAISEAQSDPRVSELIPNHLIPHNIHAMLDVPILYRGNWVGVICCEQVARSREWRLEEENFIMAIADFLCLLLESADRRRAETQVQKALAEALGLNAILDNLVDGLLVVDLQSFVTHCNPALRKIYDLPNDLAVVGSYCFDLPLAELQELICSASEQPTEVFSADMVLPKGRVGMAIATGVFSPGDRTLQTWLGIAVLIRDITNEREVDKMKTDFISTVSHELRTPLTSVLGFASIIKEKLSDEIFPVVETIEHKKLSRALKKVDSNLNIIVSEAERLTSLINDVLDIAKMEAGKIEWRMEQIGIGEVIERAFNATASLFDRSGLTSSIDISPDLPPIIGDRDRLIQVLINLISNAVKFTEQGGVTCSARLEGDELLVRVIDTGIGIAPEDCGKVFEKFKQVGDTLTDKPKGTGLGLAICMQIIEHHGGRIWVESEIGKGSTFQFSLPLNIEHRPLTQPRFDALIHQLQRQIVPPHGTESGQKRILIVDDDAHIRELLRQELEQAGYSVIEAWDGFAAIQQVKALKPDLVIMDVMMPQMNGFDAAAVLRNDPEIAEIPIIMLSIVQDKERGYRLGIDRYLTKPIDKERLLGDIESLLHQGSSTKKVLIVDQNASTARTLAEVLQAKGYVVSEALSEREGLEKAMMIKPDVIIVDAHSQESELVRALRFERDFHDVVFLLMPEAEGV